MIKYNRRAPTDSDDLSREDGDTQPTWLQESYHQDMIDWVSRHREFSLLAHCGHCIRRTLDGRAVVLRDGAGAIDSTACRADLPVRQLQPHRASAAVSPVSALNSSLPARANILWKRDRHERVRIY
jgi:hypothetical protein